MKSLYLQIEFIDKKLLPTFGISSVTDYENKIYIDEKEQHNNNINLNQLNELITEFREVFNSKNFSLHKTNYKINGAKQAINLLKTCLEITSIPHDISINSGKKTLRLISKNNTLEDYINKQKYTKMAENRNLPNNILDQSFTLDSTFNVECKNPTQSVKSYEKQIYNQHELSEEIKKINDFEYILDPIKLLSVITNEFNKKIDIMRINLKKYFGNKSINCLKLEFKSKQYDGIDIISLNFLQHFVKNITYDLCINSTRVCINTVGVDQNLLISNIIIPLKSLYYHNVIINLYDFDEIKSLLNNLEIKMYGSYVDFYAETENKLNKISFSFDLEHDNLFNTLRIMNGMAGLAFYPWQTKNGFLRLKEGNKHEQFQCQTQPIAERNKQNMSLEIKIHGTNKKLCDYEGFEFKTKPVDFVMALTPICHKYDFSSFNHHKQINNDCMIFFKSIKNNKSNKFQSYNYNLDLTDDLDCDTITNFEIFFKNINKLNSIYPLVSFLKIYLMKDDNSLFDTELTYSIGSTSNSQIKTNEQLTGPLISIVLKQNQHINVISGTKISGLALVFEFNQNNVLEQNIFEEIISELDIIVFYKKYIWDEPIRKKLNKGSNIIVDFNESYQNDNPDQNNNFMKQMIPLDV